MTVHKRGKVLVLGLRFAPYALEHEVLARFRPEIQGVPGLSPEEILAAAADASALIVGSMPKITAEVVAGLRECRGIVRAGIGLDNVDLQAAAARGIPVANVPDYCVPELSTHTVALILALVRKLPTSDRLVRAGRWELAPLHPIFAPQEMTLGLVGFGRMARAVARKARPLGFHVQAYDPYVEDAVFARAGVARQEMDPLVREADVLSLHLPLTPETRPVLDERRLRAMKPTALLVNTSRGGVVDEAALVQALSEGWIAGAGLDVLEAEPPPPDHPLFGLPNVLLTPHAAWYSERAERELRVKAAQEVARLLSGRPLRHPVRAPGQPE
ncbi:MAG: C-terminal binding protein [Deltaproteobacteria bacterium]|nr:C-terminal binding protein [Deltaproteobacteria bacterium]MBI3077207.1 C-terminal binding protein [Deltaproteobacteria bacterium]